MRMEPELITREGNSCALNRVSAHQGGQLHIISKPYQCIASGFSYLFTAAFVLAFIALGFAASATAVTILAGLFGSFQ